MSETIALRHRFAKQPELIIEHVKDWVDKVIVRLNICPFAKAEVIAQTIHYVVEENSAHDRVVAQALSQCKSLDEDPSRATTLIILSDPNLGFYSYLDIVDQLEQAMSNAGYDGTYQLASFHPQYVFGGSEDNDAANFTNRSPYPMLHLIREQDITTALSTFLRPESIPERNIEYTRRKGLAHMNELLLSCYDDDKL